MSIRHSTREAIVTAIKTVLEGVGTVETVVRRMPTFEQLKMFAMPQFPVVAMVAGLPVPDEKESARLPARLDLVVSELAIGLLVYVIDNNDDEVDTTISTLLNTLWVALYADTTLGNRVLSLKVKPIPEQAFVPPFGMFKLKVEVRYIHGLTEI